MIAEIESVGTVGRGHARPADLKALAMFVLGMLAAGGNVHGSPSNSSGLILRRPAHLLDAPATITSRSRNSNSDSMSSSLIGAIEVPIARSILRSRNSRNNLSRTVSVICTEARGCRRVSISTTAGTNPAAKGPYSRCAPHRPLGRAETQYPSRFV